MGKPSYTGVGIGASMLSGALLALIGFYAFGDADRPRAPERRALPPSLTNVEPTPPPQQPAKPTLAAPEDAGPASGCGAPPPFVGAGFVRGTTQLVDKDFAAWVPQRYEPDTRHVLLMLFHDDLQNGARFMDLTGFERIADELGFLIVAPTDKAMMAWSTSRHGQVAQQALDAMSDQLCVDHERVFAVGFGAGGRVVEELPCLFDVAGIATVSYRSKKSAEVCTPQDPVPYIHLAPLGDGYAPVDGGRACAGLHELISLEAKEAMWRERNRCESTKAKKYFETGKSKCFAWKCGDSPFASCHLDGGRNWPGMSSRLVDLKKCDGIPARFPFAETIWKFFSHGPVPPT